MPAAPGGASTKAERVALPAWFPFRYLLLALASGTLASPV
jgi:hypothetical protein